MKLLVSEYWMGFGSYSGPVELTGRKRYDWPHVARAAPKQVEILVPFDSGTAPVWIDIHRLTVECEAQETPNVGP